MAPGSEIPMAPGSEMNAAVAPGGGGPLSEALDAPPEDPASSDGLSTIGGTAGGSTKPEPAAAGGDPMMGGISDGGLSTPAVPTDGELSLVLFTLQTVGNPACISAPNGMSPAAHAWR